MSLSLLRGLAASLTLTGVVAAASIACGTSDAENRDYGMPPDVIGFNPGPGTGNDPYGGYGQGPSKVECPAELKRCSHTFTFPDRGEAKVELRGDWDGASSWETGKVMTKSGGKWTVDVPVPFEKKVQYKFIADGTWTVDAAQPTVKVGDDENNIFAGTTCEEPTCEEEGALPPGVYDWRDSVIYFVFVDRFADGNPGLNAGCKVPGVSGPIVDYAGGDWAGLTNKINEGYFNELGVNTLWITVPFENFGGVGDGNLGDPRKYSAQHGYWPQIDDDNPAKLAHESCFGSFADLKTLVSSAHKKGLKVLFDYAMVHVHSASKLFQDHPTWFWPNSKNNQPGTNCICRDRVDPGQGWFCSWDADTEKCWFTDYLPHWNYTNKEARSWSVTQAVEWVKQTRDESGNGVDGFRADAVKHIDISWLTALRAKLKTDIVQQPQQRFYMVGETYDFGNRDLIKKYIDPNTMLDGQFDFPLRRHLVEATINRKMKMSDLASFMDGNDYFYGASAVMSTFIGNHDLPRVIHLAQNTPLWDDQGNGGKDKAWEGQPGLVSEREAYERIANGFAVLFTNRGAPLLYYGDEIGLPGAGDPDNRRQMQWDGLSDSQTFLRERVSKLLDIRSKHPALRRGTRTTINSDNDSWIYMRTTTNDTVYVAVNRGDSPKTMSGLPGGALDELVEGQATTGPSALIPPRQTRIFVQR